MKLAIVADMHLGYSRFEEDALRQAESALSGAEGKADAIIVAGDVFDTKIPKLETLKRAADMFSGRKKPIFIIHG
ncbi:MAG: metallophosphoesterase, partial [Candidatus Micrarchaeia archaeon]